MVIGMHVEASEPGRVYPALGQVTGVPLCGIDGEAGTVRTFLLDPGEWKIRYVVADLGGWLDRRTVLIAPEHIGRFDWAWTAGALRVDMRQEDLDTAPRFEDGARTLLPAEEVAGAIVHATDGDVGRVRDVLVDDVRWAVRFLQVDTGDRTVLVPSESIDHADRDEHAVQLAVDREHVGAAPTFEGKGSPGRNLD